MKSKAWKAFYPVSAALKTDAPSLDPLWLASRGVEPEAPAVLRIIRTVVSPMIQEILHRTPDRKKLSTWLAHYHFLVHDRQSGVPCPENDPRAYLDLSLFFWEKVDAKKYLTEKGFVFVKPRGEDLPKKIASVEGSVEEAVHLINAQSEIYLRIVDHYKDETDETKVLQQVRQFLHYWANMAQMRIQ